MFSLIESPAIFLVGPAGSGKTSLANALSEAAEEFREIYPVMVNLDPGVKKLPYEADVDIRDYVSVEEFLEAGFGPNGAMIAATDKIIEFVSEISQEIKKLEPELVIVDTPGQMELFTHRPRGEFLVKLFGPRSLLLFLYDPVISLIPEGYVSLAFLDISVRVRMRITSFSVLSKADLVREHLSYILELASDTEFLAHELKKRMHPYASVMQEVFEKFRGEILSDLIPASSVDEPGVDMLRGEIEEVLGLYESRRICFGPRGF